MSIPDKESAAGFDNEDVIYDVEVEKILTTRIIYASILAIVLLPIWVPFDYLVDPRNFGNFLMLRIACSVVNGIALIAFIKAGKPVRHFKKYGLFIYISVIFTILPMVIMTEERYPYYIGFSTAFFAVSILLIWPLHYFLIPFFLTGLVLMVSTWDSSLSIKDSVVAIFLGFNVAVIAGLGSWLTYRNFLTNKILTKRLDRLSNTDRLTGLNNRRYFDLHLSHELARSIRERSSTALLLLDVDHFKKYNDHYGHQQGDECLRQVADCLQRATAREVDFVARYGGEEFVVVLSNSGVNGAEIIAQRIINELHELKIPHEHSPVAPFVTVSIGISSNTDTSAERLVSSADSALYKAKKDGRNRYVIA